MLIKIIVVQGGRLPTYESVGAAGADCYAHIEKPVIVKAGKWETIPLGFKVEIPIGYEMQIRGRSGIACRKGIGIVNGVGTIDCDYRGEVNSILLNNSEEDFIVCPGDRIAQAVIAPVIHADWMVVNKLSETMRGESGFGSTGK